jgi:PPP family 3-phenylpropionic acid transporter
LPAQWRLALLYAGVFGILGVELPFWPVYLKDKGIGAIELSWLLAVPNLVKLISNPLAGAWADRRRDRKLPLQTLAFIALAATSLFAITSNFWLLLILSLIAGGASAGMIPLTDNLTLTASAALRLDYGRVRLWGSISFIAASAGVGLVLTKAAPPAILWVTLSIMACLFMVTARLLPDVMMPELDGPAPSIAPLFQDKSFPIFVAATSLIMVSHSTLYGFASLHWLKAGLSSDGVGFLWAEGVIAEVILFAAGSWLLRRVTPQLLMLAAGFAGIVRWSLLAVSTDMTVLVFAQALHALTYAACHLGAMTFMHQRVPYALSARAQGVYTAVTMGLVPGLGYLAAGWLYDSMGGGAFWPMAVAAGLSLPLTLFLMKLPK